MPVVRKEGRKAGCDSQIQEVGVCTRCAFPSACARLFMGIVLGFGINNDAASTCYVGGEAQYGERWTGVGAGVGVRVFVCV